jgi:hypothetical protein
MESQHLVRPLPMGSGAHDAAERGVNRGKTRVTMLWTASLAACEGKAPATAPHTA